jgi:opacity protein-like surface antigen
MQRINKSVLCLVLTNILCCQLIFGQNDTSKVLMPAQTVPQFSGQQPNAGFDVIIKTNGDIVYGIVKEVGLDLVTYKRTDIPDGPIYTMIKSEIYAISYRNQVKEYFNPAVGEIAEPPMPAADEYNKYPINYSHKSSFQNGSLRLSLGFIKSYSKVDNKDNFSSSGTFPAVNIGYDVYYNNKVRLGVQIGFGSRHFTKQDYSTYDSIQNNIDTKENLFSLFVYSRYILMTNSSRIKPYLIGGLGIYSSRINSENTVNFTNNPSQTVLITSGLRSVGLGIMARGGAEYYVNNQLQAFADIGVGLTVVSLGISFNLK